MVSVLKRQQASADVPAEGDRSQSPTRRHLSGCSVFKNKTNSVWMHLSQNSNRSQAEMDDFTCFWAAKMTFIKFMYWRVQSSAAFITYPVKHRGCLKSQSRQQTSHKQSYNEIRLSGSPVFLILFPVQLKKEKETLMSVNMEQYPLKSIIKFNIKNIYSPSNSFETLWISLYQEIKENTLAKSSARLT